MVLDETSVYGPNFRKDQKIVSGINSYIASKKLDLPVNLFEGSDHLIHATVRSTALKLFFGLVRYKDDFPVSGG